MKYSQYNLCSPSQVKGHTFIYNLLRGTYALLPDNAFDDIAVIPEKTKDSLISQGILLDDEIDEYDVFQYWNMVARFRDNCLYMTILTTDDCNLRCSYCYQNNVLEKVKSRTMQKETIDELVRFCEDMRTSGRYTTIDVSFYGGEPMLNEEGILRIAHYIQKNWLDYRMSITTNGTLFTEENLDVLYAHGIRGIQISVDGTEEMHNHRRPLPGHNCYQVLFRNIDYALRKGYRIALAVNIDQENESTILDLFDDIAHKLPHENLYIALGFIFDTAESQAYCSTHQIMDNVQVEILRPIYERLSELGLKVAARPGFGACTYESPSMLVVDAGGEAYSCVSGVGLERFYLGKLDQYNSERMWMMRGEILPLSQGCKECAMLPICKGGCRYRAYSNGNPRGKLFCRKEGLQELYTFVAQFLYEEELLESFFRDRGTSRVPA